MPDVADQPPQADVPPHDARPDVAERIGHAPSEAEATASPTGPGANGMDGYDNLTKVSFIGISVGLILLAVGVGLTFLAGRSQGLGNMPILIACVGLGAVLAGLGSQARYISNEVALGGGVAIAMVFYLTFVQLNKEEHGNRYEGQLTVLSGKAAAVPASLWISNDNLVKSEIMPSTGDQSIYKFNFSRDQVNQIFDTYCSRFEFKHDNKDVQIHFDSSKIQSNDYSVVLRMYYDAKDGLFYYYDKKGIRRIVPKECPPAIQVAEKNAILEDVKQSPPDKVAPTTTVVSPPVVTGPPPGRWSYFGIRSDDGGFVEKTFDIVARGQGAPPATNGSVPLKGDTLLALVDVRVRAGARRLAPGTSNQWVNAPLVDVVKAGERVKVIEVPRIANSVSYWVPISDKLE